MRGRGLTDCVYLLQVLELDRPRPEIRIVESHADATARRFEDKATRLRKIRMKGDAERERQAKRDTIRPKLTKGLTVDSGRHGVGIVEKINQKTARLRFQHAHGDTFANVDLSVLRCL